MVLVAIPPSLILLGGTEDHACSALLVEQPSASRMARMEPSDPVPLISSHCEIETVDGIVYGRSNTNWLGLLLALCLLAGAWILGAGLGGSLSWRASAQGISVCAGVFLAGLVVFFV